MSRGIHPPAMQTHISPTIRGRISSHRAQRLNKATQQKMNSEGSKHSTSAKLPLLINVFGRLLSKIEELKLRDNTLVVILSDHGTQLRDQGRFGKGPDQLHPFNTQLNLLIRHPERQQAQDVDAFVQNHDLMPTVLHQLGIPCDWTDGNGFLATSDR